MGKGGQLCLVLVATLVVALLPPALIFAVSFAFPGSAIPVEVAVDEASLGRLDLVDPGNGTAYVAYNLSLAVAVRNPNMAKLAWRGGAPLDAELRLAGNPFALVRLAGPETTDRIRPFNRTVYRVAAAAAKSAPVALGSDEVVALARDSVVGMFHLELIVAGEFNYGGSGGSSIITVRCPLLLPLSTVPAAVAFARFERTLPQPCTDISAGN